MATAIIRPTAYIEQTSGRTNNPQYAYDNNVNTGTYAASAINNGILFKDFDTSALPNNIDTIKNIKVCLQGSVSKDFSVRVCYGATTSMSSGNYTDCGDGTITITMAINSTNEVFSASFVKATEYWNNNISSFLNGDIQVRLGSLPYSSSSRTLREVFIEVEYELPTITVATSASPPEGGIVTGGGTYESGSTVTVTATQNDGYVFSHWLINGVNFGNSNPISGALTADTAIVAVFEKVQTSKIHFGADKAKAMFDTQKNKAKSVWYGTERIL